MNIVIFGPPGAGKGTQSNLIVKKFNLHQLSTGELLRKEIKSKIILSEYYKIPFKENYFDFVIGFSLSKFSFNSIIKLFLLDILFNSFTIKSSLLSWSRIIFIDLKKNKL